MKTSKKWLVVKGNGDMRIVGRLPTRLNFDEIAFPLTVNIPDTWGKVYNIAIDVTMPDPDEPTVLIGQLSQ